MRSATRRAYLLFLALSRLPVNLPACPLVHANSPHLKQDLPAPCGFRGVSSKPEPFPKIDKTHRLSEPPVGNLIDCWESKATSSFTYPKTAGSMIQAGWSRLLAFADASRPGSLRAQSRHPLLCMKYASESLLASLASCAYGTTSLTVIDSGGWVKA